MNKTKEQPAERKLIVGAPPAKSLESIDRKLSIIIKFLYLHLLGQGFEQKTLESVLKGEEAQD